MWLKAHGTVRTHKKVRTPRTRSLLVCLAAFFGSSLAWTNTAFAVDHWQCWWCSGSGIARGVVKSSPSWTHRDWEITSPSGSYTRYYQASSQGTVSGNGTSLAGSPGYFTTEVKKCYWNGPDGSHWLYCESFVQGP